MALEEDEDQGEEAEDEGVFLRFGDDLAVDSNLYRALCICRKISSRGIIVGSRKEVADGFVDQAGARPSRSLPVGKGQIAPRDANPHLVKSGIILHKKVGNGSIAAADGNGRRVGGAGGKGDVGLAAARNSGSHRSDVFGIGTGKQGRKLKVGIARFVGVVDVSAIGRGKPPSVVWV